MLAAANSVFGRWDETKGEEVRAFVVSLYYCSGFFGDPIKIDHHSFLPLEHRLHANYIVPF